MVRTANMTMPIEDKLRWLRERDGRSQKDLAENIGRFQTRVSKWEVGVGKPEPQDILAIAKYFNVPFRYLLDDEIEYPEDCKPELDWFAFLPHDYQVVWTIVRQIGAQTALDRLLGPAAEQPPGPPTPGRPITAGEMPPSAHPKGRTPRKPPGDPSTSAAAHPNGREASPKKNKPIPTRGPAGRKR